MNRAVVGAGMLVVGAVALTLGTRLLDPAWVERVYARGVFPVIGQGLGAVTGLVPMSVAEVAGVPLVLLLVVLLLRGARRVRTWAMGVGLAAGVWIAFAPLWGLNYRRLSAGELFGLDPRPSSVAELRALAEELVVAAGEQWVPVEDWRPAFVEAPHLYATAGEDHPFLAGTYARPKALYGSEVLSWLGLLGVYSPFTAEANVNVAAPAFVVPDVVLHEMAHQRGIAAEDEANFVAWKVGSTYGSPIFRYSTTWRAMRYALAALYRDDPDAVRALLEGLDPRVAEDNRTYKAWLTAHESVVGEVSQKVNDTYLRAQGEADGVRSYGRVVDLLLAERRARLGE